MKRLAAFVLIAVFLTGAKWGEDKNKENVSTPARPQPVVETSSKGATIVKVLNSPTVKALASGTPEETRARAESLKRLTASLAAKRRAQKK